MERGVNMRQTLQEMFPSFVVYEEINEEQQMNYSWFMTPEQERIGILTAEMTDREQQLLQTFLKPYTIHFPLVTEKEKGWQAFLRGESESPRITGFFRFVAFTFNGEQLTPVQFKAAICELFSYEVPILWKSDCEGVLIEEVDDREECTSYAQIIDVLMSDLYVSIKFLVGPFNQEMEYAHMAYDFTRQAAGVMFKQSNNHVSTYMDAVPYYLLSGSRGNVRRILLKDLENDGELLKMIDVFLACNLNLSETAKELHLHRNSLQYRIDRLYEKVGIDIRNFHHAMALYLSILAEN